MKTFPKCDPCLTKDSTRALIGQEACLHESLRKHGCDSKMFFFSRVNHASMSLWDENSTSLLYSHTPSSAGTWRIFPNMLCQCFFPFSWHFKREKSVFWKASFFAIQELMTLARIRVKDFATGENKFSKHWRHQILRGPLESLYKASCLDCKDFYIGKTKRSFRALGGGLPYETDGDARRKFCI